jgi:hypothetical protein
LNLPSGLGEGIFFSILSKLEYNIRFTFQSSSLKPLGRLEPSVAGISYSENVCVFGV